MKRWMKRLGITVLSLVVLVITVGAGVYGYTGMRLRRTFSDIKVEQVNVPSDSAAVESGRRFASAITKCSDCHGGNLQGQIMIEDPAFGTVAAPNLTSGKGGVASNYTTDADWVRAIRHGVRPDGSALIIMPSQIYYTLSDADLGIIIAYLKSLAPQDNELPRAKLGPVARALYAAKQLPIFAVEQIDHEATRPADVTPGVTVEYGKYLSVVGGCLECHGKSLEGGSLHPGSPPDAKLPPNLTPAGAVAGWSEEDFFNALRTGRRPNGQEISSEMPWRYTAQMTDDEIRATWAYLRSVPAVQPVAAK